MIEIETLTPQDRETLVTLVEDANEKLEQAGQSGANYAFNLGCTVGLIPAIGIVLVTFIFSRGSWVMAAVAGLLMILAILVFANLVASIAKSRSIDRTYQINVNPEIERTIKGMAVPRLSFNSLAWEVLPEGAVLRSFLPVPPSTDAESPEEP